ncbi:hypothetical protein Rsub_10899 [Raphidocelis subcapitata]|uniref:Uncharacterized protein n=1 Tax=Raphidocelis subcapitata TaxID=307507 RepID=A0A2V0PL47_9CHLO|nr:hypothetical protein Rsub_10899 [Raphidocelis subcapitata]|eukprot:GBF97735.1 hypothetical protein Rsub_10899 [Raphidocelis subcapitata]
MALAAHRSAATPGIAPQRRPAPARALAAAAPRPAAAPQQHRAPRPHHPQRGPRAVAAPAFPSFRRGAAEAAAAASTAAFPGLQSAVAPLVPAALAAAAAALGAVALLTALAPASQAARRVARSNIPYVLIGLAYGVVLLASWQADTLALMMPGSWADGFKGGFNPQFLPSLDSVATLFSRSFTSASFLLHTVFINMFAARWIYNNGFDERLPTSHSILLAALVGPLGVLSHLITKAAFAAASAAAGRDLRPRGVQVRSEDGGGVITIMPYDG